MDDIDSILSELKQNIQKISVVSSLSDLKRAIESDISRKKALDLINETTYKLVMSECTKICAKLASEFDSFLKVSKGYGSYNCIKTINGSDFLSMYPKPICNRNGFADTRMEVMMLGKSVLYLQFYSIEELLKDEIFIKRIRNAAGLEKYDEICK